MGDLYWHRPLEAIKEVTGTPSLFSNIGEIVVDSLLVSSQVSFVMVQNMNIASERLM